MKNLLKYISFPVALGTFGILVWLENRRPLRSSVESKIVRNSRNLAVAGIAAVTLQIFEKPVFKPLCELVERKNLGLLKVVKLPK